LVLFAPAALNDHCPLQTEAERLPPLMDAKKGKTRKESAPIKVWVTPEEKAAIAAKADAHSLSASSYLRRLGLAMPLQSTIDQQAILDLVKINADLGRFGGLIKMWLTTNADFESVSAQGLQHKLESTLSDVRLLQKQMSDRLEDL
jgi:hypothetical protein